MPDAALDLRTLLLKPNSRGHMELMLEAELMESSPEAVAAWLKARGRGAEGAPARAGVGRGQRRSPLPDRCGRHPTTQSATACTALAPSGSA